MPRSEAGVRDQGGIGKHPANAKLQGLAAQSDRALQEVFEQICLVNALFQRYYPLIHYSLCHEASWPFRSFERQIE